MGDVFKGWRRKIGVVTLGLACLFAVDWITWLCFPHNEDMFSNSEQFAIPLTFLSAYLLLSKPLTELKIEPPTMTHDGGPLPASLVKPGPKKPTESS